MHFVNREHTPTDIAELERAKQVANSTSFEGDLRVGLMRALTSCRVLNREVETLEKENAFLRDMLDNLRLDGIM